MVMCDTQAEIDRYWNAMLERRQAERAAGCAIDIGVLWQIVPAMMQDGWQILITRERHASRLQ